MLHISSCIIKLALPVHYITNAHRAWSSWPVLILFWAPRQVWESRKESGEQQNLGQGLRLFKCTIGALNMRAGGVQENGLQTFKTLKEVGNVADLHEQDDLCVHGGAGSSGWQKIPGLTWRHSNTMCLVYFGKSDGTSFSSAFTLMKNDLQTCRRVLWNILLQLFSSPLFLASHPSPLFLLLNF